MANISQCVSRRIPTVLTLLLMVTTILSICVVHLLVSSPAGSIHSGGQLYVRKSSAADGNGEEEFTPLLKLLHENAEATKALRASVTDMLKSFTSDVLYSFEQSVSASMSPFVEDAKRLLQQQHDEQMARMDELLRRWGGKDEDDAQVRIQEVDESVLAPPPLADAAALANLADQIMQLEGKVDDGFSKAFAMTPASHSQDAVQEKEKRKRKNPPAPVMDASIPCPSNYPSPIYISLTTTPSRMDALFPHLQRLSSQTHPVSAVLVSIPFQFKRTGEEYPALPKFLTNGSFPSLRILRGEDYGPATKFLMPLEVGDLPDDAVLVVLDDDIMYSTDLVCDYVKVAEIFPNAALSRRGQSFRDNCDPFYDTEKTYRYSHDKKEGPNFVIQEVDLISGMGSYWVKKLFFDAAVFSHESCPTNVRDKMFFTDDIWISGYLAYRGVQRLVFSQRLSIGTGNSSVQNEGLHQPYKSGSGKDSLFLTMNKNSDNNNVAVRAMARYWGCPQIHEESFEAFCEFPIDLTRKAFEYRPQIQEEEAMDEPINPISNLNVDISSGDEEAKGARL